MADSIIKFDTTQYAIRQFTKTMAHLQEVTDARWTALEELNDAIACFGADSYTAETFAKKERQLIRLQALAEDDFASAGEFAGRLFCERNGVNVDDAVTALLAQRNAARRGAA